MLDPEYLAQMPEPILRLWREGEQKILADMARRISTYDYWIPAADHQSAMLRLAGHTQEEILAALAPVTRRSEAELRQMMIEAGSRCLAEDAEFYRAAGLDVPDPAKHAGLTSTLNTGYQQTAQTMRNLTRTTARTATGQFEAALDRAWLQVNSGAFDYDSAIRGAIKDLAEAGISAIRYPSGRTDSIETAVRRAVLTGINQTAGKLSMELADEVGCDLVEVSAHAGARPEHALWQGRIYSRSGKSEKYPDFVASTGYGTGAGLCGWNCRHSFGPYVEGAPRVWTDEKLAELNEPKYEYNGEKLTEYEARQKENYFNRQIHRWTREAEAMRAAGQDPSEPMAKAREWRARKKDFLEKRTVYSATSRQIKELAALRTKYGSLESLMFNGSAKEMAQYQAIMKRIGLTESEIERKMFADPDCWEAILSSQTEKQMEKFTDLLLETATDSELGALNMWTGETFGIIQKQTRYGAEIDSISAHAAMEIEQILGRVVTPEDLIVTRGTGTNHLFKQLGVTWGDDPASFVGKSWLDNGFVATSPFPRGGFSGSGKNRAEMFVYVPKGTNAAYIAQESHYQDREKELLIQRGYSYRILKAEYRQNTYFADEKDLKLWVEMIRR